MSLTKREFHDEICRQIWDDEEEYFAAMEIAIDESDIDWFSDYRLAHDGYEEENVPTLTDEDIPF